jgi:hypothetical protein
MQADCKRINIIHGGFLFVDHVSRLFMDRPRSSVYSERWAGRERLFAADRKGEENVAGRATKEAVS